MKLLYISNIRIPTERAHGLQVMKTCEAISNDGIDLELVVPDQKNKQDPFTYYGIKQVFKLRRVSVYNLLHFKKIGFIAQSFLFSFLVIFSLGSRLKTEIIYSRDIFTLAILILFGCKNVYFESHAGEYNFVVKYVLKRVRGIVCITHGLKNHYLALGVKEKKITIAPDGVDLKLFRSLPTRAECRGKLGLPLDKKIIMYVGSFFSYEWKGLDTFLETARKFGAEYIFCAVGGSESEIRDLELRGVSSNVSLIERKPNIEIPFFLRAADVLVLPNKSGDIISEKFTSPMKLFEYLASGTPIVASRLESLKEVLHENNCLFFTPNDTDSLSSAITKIVDDQSLAAGLVLSAATEAERYSWTNRARQIIQLLKKNESHH